MLLTNPSPIATQCGSQVTRYPTDLAQRGMYWPARDEDRLGRYIVCPYDPDKPFSLAVVDDYGTLTPVPHRLCKAGVAAIPTTGAPQ
jgi:hypothetical protein